MTIKNITNSRLFIIICDILSISFAWFISYWLRFNLSNIPSKYVWQAVLYLPCIIVIQLVICWYFGLYRSVSRFASIHDLLKIIKSSILGGLCFLALIYTAALVGAVPKAIVPIYCMLIIFSQGGLRFLYRLKVTKKSKKSSIKVLVVGAGQAGEGLIRDMLRDTQHVYNPVGFVDDDLRKHRYEIHGVRVLGSSDDIAHLVKKHSIEMLIIAIPSANAEAMRNIVNQAEIAKIPFRTLPGLNALAEGRITINALREVSLEDLLGRDPIQPTWAAIRLCIFNKCVVVTGGGGSIGSELCRQVATLNPKELIIIEQNEFNLYEIERELVASFPQLNLKCILLDILDKVAIEDIFRNSSPHIVFHAAAYKHVPLLENQIRTAVVNNVLGTEILARAAIENKIEKFVLISTDKAVNPSSVMGISKRAAELFCQSINDTCATQFITVRFGNVLGSAGSVIPLFKKQIELGGPITITHPDIIRYFMTIPEAAQLILQASSIGQGGEIFVLDMGQPIKIQYLAEQLIRLAGLEPGKDIKLVYTGLRPGEKMYEELFYSYEIHDRTAHKKIIKANSKTIDFDAICSTLELIKRHSEERDEASLYLQLNNLIANIHDTNQNYDKVSQKLPSKRLHVVN